jgi:asparagine synthase (glutamine-hydrolysing)
MCGIAGTVRFEGAARAVDRAAAERMLAAQQSRGPDGQGLRMCGPAVLGHRRLSIIDLSDVASQPMPNETRDVWVTFNGEIYNYRELRSELQAAGHHFESSSDTEVLVHGYEEWGSEGLYRRLRGMFAFAIQDERPRSEEEPFFFAARDRLGIKPFYYTVSEGRLAFASEVKALVRGGAAAPEVDRCALAAFLSLGSVPFPRTWLKGVECLAPGHSLEVSRKGLKIRKYWDISYEDAGSAAGLGNILQDSVARHLVADVPVGVFLSGGVDSAGVACLAARGRTAPVRTLTIVFDEHEFDEAATARNFARSFGAEHQEIRVTSSDFERAIPHFLDCMDQPTADGVNTWFVSRAAREAGLKVVLSGLGGDEIFFGYSHYKPLTGGAGMLGGYMRSGAFTRAIAGRGAAFYGHALGSEKWKRFDYCRNRPLHESLYLLIRGFFPPDDVCRLTGASPKDLEETLEASFGPVRVFGENGHVEPNRFHYLEMKRYLHDQLLRDSDVFSMSHSIELRVPLLDDRLVEAGCQIAPAEKMAGGMNKPKLVDAIGNAAVRETASRPKRGFVFPFATWMRSNANSFEERALAGNTLDREAVRHCWKEFRAGRMHWSRAWATVVAAALAERARSN